MGGLNCRESVMRVSIVAALAGILVFAASQARADACSDLWYSRNSIYRSGGYCFKTSRAIRAFGNAGCQYDDVRDVPLSLRDRQRVDGIVRDEAAMGCRD